jgi:hypothetical protein
MYLYCTHVLCVNVYVGMLSPGFSDAVQVQAAAALEKGISIQLLVFVLYNIKQNCYTLLLFCLEVCTRNLVRLWLLHSHMQRKLFVLYNDFIRTQYSSIIFAYICVTYIAAVVEHTFYAKYMRYNSTHCMQLFAQCCTK